MQIDGKHVVLYAGFSASYGVLTMVSSYLLDSIFSLPAVYKKHMGDSMSKFALTYTHCQAASLVTAALPIATGFAFKPHAVGVFFFGMVPLVAASARVLFKKQLDLEHDKNETKIQGLVGGTGMAFSIALTSLLQYFRYL